MCDCKMEYAMRKCDNPACDMTFPQTGDGCTPYLSTDEGGKYFCSWECRRVYMDKLEAEQLNRAKVD